jgi:choline dehydrogenase-like flavoprotein
MTFLTEREKQTLIGIADTLLPELQAAGALSLDVPELLVESLERVTGCDQRRLLKLFLRLIEIPLVNGITARRWRSFSSMTLQNRAHVLQVWSDSPLELMRRAFQGVKRITLFLCYATSPNPTWSRFDFKGPPGVQTSEPGVIKPTAVTAPSTLQTDVLIVGSGAGGGVMAGELSAAGYEVLVIEKGAHHDDMDFHGQELESNRDLFENSGALTTDDVSMAVLAGSTLGGGTTVNWMTSLRPPQFVLEEWERDYGFSGVTSADYQRSLDAVSKRINVNTAESIPNAQNSALERGCKVLGYDVAVLPRNVKGCEECGFCNFGCPFGAKQGTLKTYLQDAYERGARIVVRGHVDRVTHQAGQVTGALAMVEDADGHPHEVSIRAKAVIVSAGSIHTPALLKRSGLQNRNIGENLHLHPVTTATGEYDDPMLPWQGPPQSRMLNQFIDLDGRGYGYRIETPAAQPGIIAATLSWRSGEQHHAVMGHIHHFASFIVLTRDFYGGRVRLNRDGQPVLHYHLHPHDARHMMHGLLEALRIQAAAGARILYSPHAKYLVHQVNGQSGLDDFLATVERQGLRRNAFALFSAHQMSSCRIAGDAKRGAVKPDGESYEIKNLFVADASVFPTASGVNPMLTIMGTAHFLAQHIKAKLS